MTEKKTKKHKVRSIIFRIFLIIVAGLTVGLSVFSWNASRVVGNLLPMPFGVGASVVLSGSMEPTLKVNDLVVVKEEPEYHVDDIVVYQENNQLIIHRIIRSDGEEVITKGDANNTADEPILAEQIKGKFVFRIPFLGFVIKMIKTVPGTLCILALVVFLLYRSRRKEKNKDNEELDSIVAEIRRLQALQQSDQSATASPVQNTVEQPVANNEEDVSAPDHPAEPDHDAEEDEDDDEDEDEDDDDSVSAGTQQDVTAADAEQVDSGSVVSPEAVDELQPSATDAAVADSPAHDGSDSDMNDLHALLDDLAE